MRSKIQIIAIFAFLAVLSLFLPTAALAGSCSTVSGNLVANCGFETGSFSSWTISNLNATSVQVAGFHGYLPHSGNYFAALGNVGSDGVISQTLSTVVGQTYDITFYLASDGSTPNDFSASFGSTKLIDLVNTPLTTGYVQYTFAEVAISGSTTLTFTERNDPGYWALDDISVAPVSGAPEPGVLVLLPLSLIGLGLLSWKLTPPSAVSSQATTA